MIPLLPIALGGLVAGGTLGAAGQAKGNRAIANAAGAAAAENAAIQAENDRELLALLSGAQPFSGDAQAGMLRALAVPSTMAPASHRALSAVGTPRLQQVSPEPFRQQQMRGIMDNMALRGAKTARKLNRAKSRQQVEIEQAGRAGNEMRTGGSILSTASQLLPLFGAK